MTELYSGFIVVRLGPAIAPPPDVEISDLRALARDRGSIELSRVLDDYSHCATGRLVSSLGPKQIVELEQKAAQRGSAPRRSLSSDRRIDAREINDPDQLVERLTKVNGVEVAYRELRGKSPDTGMPGVVGATAARQLHIDPAPVGIDASFARAHPHGGGESVAFVDLEGGWIFDHEAAPPIVFLPNVSRQVRGESLQHGTAVLGIVAATSNPVGIVGIARSPRFVSVTSHVRPQLGNGDFVVDAIVDVVPHMDEGDVLLVEWQTALFQVAEADPAVADAIDFACSQGIVVVESAGNGGIDLDTIPTLNRNGPPSIFEDTGAIVVGACHSSLDATGAAHNRWIHPAAGPTGGSNFGSRVDCHAFGEHVVTIGPGRTAAEMVGTGVGPQEQYRRDFGGTSAAAAIVAGAAVVLQNMHKAKNGRSLSPTEMRAALSSHGTPQGAGRAGNIGVMPDLRKAALALGL